MFDDPMPNFYVSRRPDRFATLRWGRWRPAFRVELEVVEWSANESEVAIRPSGNGAVRRPFVYATAAGYAVDELVALVRGIAWDRAQHSKLEAVDELRRAS